MRRLFRRLFTLCSILSLLLCVAVCVLWVRSQSMSEEILIKSKRTTLQVITHGQDLFLRLWLPYEPKGERKTGVFHKVGRQYNLRRPTYPPDTPLLTRMGFALHKSRVFDREARSVKMPYWFLILLTLVAPVWAWAAGSRLWRNRRAGLGLCPTCGYDLRATPDRCPECGTDVLAQTT